MSAVPLHTDERIARLTMISTVFWAVEKHHGTSDIITREGPFASYQRMVMRQHWYIFWRKKASLFH